jgi:ABC-type Fe3+ transport system permease subunit
LLKNSLLVSSLATVVAMTWGVLVAMWAAGLAPRWQRWVLGVALVALAMPPFLVTNAWLDLLAPSGLAHRWLPVPIFSLGGAAWILSLLLWPITLFATWGAWQRLEPAQLECDPAVAGSALLRGLLLPLAAPALVPAAVLTFVLALNNFAVPAILQVKVLPAEIWVRFNTTLQSREVLAISWPLVVAPLLVLAWLSRRPVPWPHLAGTVSARLFRQQLGRAWSQFSGLAALSVCFLAVAVPLSQILFARRTWTEMPGALAAGQSAIWNSFWISGVSATLVIMLGLAWGARRPYVSERTSRLAPWLWLPFFVPGVLLGIGLIWAFNRSATAFLYQSAGIVVLAFGLRYLGLGCQGIGHASAMVDRDLIDVARVEGASAWQLLRHVLWPQIAPAALAVGYVVFLLCLWDVESMLLVVPPGGETLALRIFNLLHYGHNAQVNALCLALLGVAVAPLAFYGLWRLGNHFGFPPLLSQATTPTPNRIR